MSDPWHELSQHLKTRLPSRRHHWIKRIVHDFEYSPEFQIRFHLWAMSFWMMNAVVGTVLIILWPHLWLSIGVYYVFMLSLYANWDTDYDAVSAASAFKHAKKVDERK